MNEDSRSFFDSIFCFIENNYRVFLNDNCSYTLFMIDIETSLLSVLDTFNTLDDVKMEIKKNIILDSI